MAAGSIPKPGSKLGPCAEPCTHRDCRASRQDAEALCRFCQKRISYGREFYRSRLDGALAHAACLEAAAERNDARVGLF